MAVTRRRLTLLIPLAAALVASGCTTFSDADAVARVGDIELSSDDLDELLLEAGAPPEELEGGLPLEPIRGVISQWIRDTASDTDPEDVDDLFDLGFVASGVTCPQVMYTESPDTAEAAEDRLRDGESFVDVFDELNIEPSITPELGCFTLESFDPELLQTAPDLSLLLELDGDNPLGTASIDDGAGSTVGFLANHRSLDELSEADRAVVEQTVRAALTANVAFDDVDVHVDSRYGTFDDQLGSVVALG